MKNILGKTSVLVGAALMMASVGIQTTANATSAQTVCTYKLINGAPWAPEYKTIYLSGHVQCEPTAHEAIGGYTLVSQRHI